MSHPKSLVLEVSHDWGFARYHMVYVKLGEINYNMSYKMLPRELDERVESTFLQIWREVEENHLFKEGYNIYYIKMNQFHVESPNKVTVNINDTQGLLFNIPINLLVGAATSAQSEITFYEDNRSILRMVRHHKSVEIIDEYSRNVRYSISLYSDHLVFNELSPRSIQFEHFARLFRCPEFVQTINNGNLALAYADTYMGNLDDDVIDGDVFTNSTIYQMYYDQFSGPYEGNVIEVTTSSGNNEVYGGEYQANELNSGLAELLQHSVVYISQLPSE